jgi:hypothetical protein
MSVIDGDLEAMKLERDEARAEELTMLKIELMTEAIKVLQHTAYGRHLWTTDNWKTAYSEAIQAVAAYMAARPKLTAPSIAS